MKQFSPKRRKHFFLEARNRFLPKRWACVGALVVGLIHGELARIAPAWQNAVAETEAVQAASSGSEKGDPSKEETQPALPPSETPISPKPSLQTPPEGPQVDLTEEAVFVAEGKPELVEPVGQKWAQGEGYLEGSGQGVLLRTVRAIGSGDFHIKIELTLLQVERSGASVVLGEGNHFGFSGGNHRMFVEGPIFPGQRQILGPTEELVPEGRRFCLEILRKEKQIRFLIDGRQVYSMPSDGGPIGQVALRPWRSRMRVHQFVATGRILDIPRSSAELGPTSPKETREADREKSKSPAQEPATKPPATEDSEEKAPASKESSE